MTTKYIVSKGWQGFGDRLQCLSYCLNSALRYNRSLYVDWNDTIWQEGFYRYFHFVDLPFVTSDKDIKYSTIYPAFWKHKLMLPANAWVYNIKNELEFEPLKNLHYEDVWVHSGIGYREYDFNQLPKHLRLNDDIAQEIKARLIDFDLPVVHLRGTDREVSESKWAELRSAAPIAWVISDDKALIDRWMAESPESKVFSNAKAGVNHLTEDANKHEMILQLLTDFFAIASADTAYALSDDSLFFSMARLLGMCGGLNKCLNNFSFPATSVVNATTKPIFVSYYTPNGDYPGLAHKLLKSLKKHDLDHDIEQLPEFTNWVQSTSHKAKFITKKLLQYKRPVIWIDCDCEIVQYPDLLMQDSDIAIVNWFALQDHHLDGKILFDVNTDKALFTGMLSKWSMSTVNLLKQWQDELNISKLTEDEVLSDVWNAECRNSLSRVWLPKNYASGLFAVSDAVIQTKFNPYPSVAVREARWRLN